MSKCFITKLPSSVDNDNLPVLGQLRINWLKQSDLTDNDARAIGLKTIDTVTVKVSGAHFTDNTLASNIGNIKTITASDEVVWLYVSNDADAVLTIDNKYSLLQLTFVRPGKDNINRLVYFDIEDIKYCTNLNSLSFSYTQVSGDISAVSKLTNLNDLTLPNIQVSGDINALSNLTNLMYLNLSSTQVSGDISAVSKLTKFTYLILNYTQVSGDISVVSKLTNLNSLTLPNTQVSGDINALSNLTNLTYLDLSRTQVSGDISVLSNLTKAISINMGNTKVSGDITSIVNNINNMTQLKTLVIPRAVTITDEQKKILTDRGCTVGIV